MNIINGPNADYHVQDCSTDHCPHCGKVLNQCTCPQVLQRVDFGNKELEAENEQLKKQLEKAKCCGNCKWWIWADCYDQDDYCNCKKSGYYCQPRDPDKLCCKWEVRG